MLEICFKKIKKLKVYTHGKSEPWGIVRDVCLENNTPGIRAIVVETISLIPISRMIEFKDIKHIGEREVVLNENFRIKKVLNENSENFVSVKNIYSVKNNKSQKSLFRDMRFDTETGEITDVIFSKNFFSQKTKIPINKITVKENTIYIDNEK